MQNTVAQNGVVNRYSPSRKIVAKPNIRPQLSLVTTTPLSGVIDNIKGKVRDETKLRESLALWNCHGISTNEAVRDIKAIVRREAGSVAVMDVLTAQRNKIDFIQDWRIAALRRGQGCSRIWSDEILRLDEQTDFISKAKPIMQDLRPATREKILQDELVVMRDHINSLRDRSRFITRISPMSLSDIESRLKERAIQAFRWTYPFVDHPGKVMTTAVANYIINMKRDAFVFNKEVVMSNDDIDIRQSSDNIYHIDSANDASLLETTIRDLDEKVLESLLLVLNEKGVGEFAHAMSYHMDASPARILRMMGRKN